MTQRSLTLLLAIGLVTVGLAGCLGDSDEPLDPTATEPGSEAPSTARGWSMPTDPAQYDVLEGVSVQVESFDGTPISLGIFRPDIDGCDWDAPGDELPDECQVPVVMDSGPYWGTNEEELSYRPPLVEWLVPRGYAVVHMSVRGTGESGGCMEFMSMNEQKDVDHVVTWLADQAWTNGNVGMMGRSYDGTTPFMAAAAGNPNLKTIVPISGVASVPDLMFKNGTSELRGPIMHNVVYWASYGLLDEPPASLASQACQETVDAQIEGTDAFLTGDTSSEYWQVRDFRERIIENYNGSLWIIHGMEDWNVNPSQVVPWIHELKHEDKEVRAWLGQWAHAYPDRVDEHRNVRWDFAQEVVDWFDHYLKDKGPQPSLTVEAEDSLYVWHEYEAYPPHELDWRALELGAGGQMTEPGEASSGQFVLTGPPTGVAVSGDVAGAGGPHAIFTSEPLSEDIQVSGLARLHVTVTPSSAQGGQLFANLYDVFPDGREVRIGWAAIHLQHHEGGNTDPQMLTPGQPVVAKMQFEPMEAHVAQGHQLRLQIDKAGVEDILPTKNPEPNILELGGEQSLLKLPVVDEPPVVEGYQPPGLGARAS